MAFIGLVDGWCMPLTFGLNGANRVIVSSLWYRASIGAQYCGRQSLSWAGHSTPSYSLNFAVTRRVNALYGSLTCSTERAISGEGDALSDLPDKRVHRYVKPHGLRVRGRPPSATLIEALKESGYDYTLPRKVRGKVDHTYISAWELDRRKRLGRSSGLPQHFEEPHEVLSELSLQSILASYIRSLHSSNFQQNTNEFDVQEDTQEKIVQVFDDKSLALLRERDFDIEDVVSWAWILTAQSSEQAVLRLLAISNKTSAISSSRVPTFVFLFLLRRQTITASALRLLIIHAWDRIENRHNPAWATSFTKEFSASTTIASTAGSLLVSSQENAADYPLMDETSVAVMLVRLFRHARRQWPAGYTSIAAILTKRIGTTQNGEKLVQAGSADLKALKRLTFVYNKMLSFLALPTTHHPYLSISHQERAQFNILRRMNEFEPALSINREGYRAVAHVQLAHRKTLLERRWAQLKSKSWPPWKEEKLGTDAELGIDMGRSRALEALSTLKESGYAFGDWENAAMILAGWDTDRSPTIQTRTILSLAPSPRLVLSKGQESSISSAILVWEARVRATRTVDEAWACFLSYKDEDLPTSTNVYLAMLEKLVFDEKRRKADHALSSRSDDNVLSIEAQTSISPGDGLETAPLPSNPRDRIYVRTPTPDTKTFYTSMIADGVIPAGRLLSFLLDYAETYDDGAQYLRASNLSPIEVQMLIGQTKPNLRDLQKIPQHVFSSFIGLLARSSIQPPGTNRTAGDSHIPHSPLLHAMRLMFVVRPKRHATWNSLLRALAHKNAKVDEGYRHRYSTDDIKSWHSLIWLVDEMKKADLNVDFGGFQTLCLKYEKIARKAAVASRQLKDTFGSVGPDFSVREGQLREWQRREDEANEILGDGLVRLKGIFKKLVSTDPGGWAMTAAEDKGGFLLPGSNDATYDPSLLLPRLLGVPHPAQLHAFIRAMGAAEDGKGICDLLHWMEYVAPEIKAALEETGNGPRMFRRTLVAARVFLERATRLKEEDFSEEPFADSGDGKAEAGDRDSDEGQELQEAREIVERVEGWGGWPGDEEAEAYLEKSNLAV